jgi:uncharacterized protein (TIGR02145 family)
MKEIHSKGKRFFASTLAAGFLLAMAFTFTACGDDSNNDNGTSTEYSSSSSSTGSSTDDGSSSSKQDITSSSSNTSSSSDGSVNYTDKGNSIASYETIGIGDQVWMAENLNYKVEGSKCYGEGSSGYSASEVQANCDKYGRLYDWATAMNLPQSCNSQLVTNCGGQVNAKHQGICPNGWHLPSGADWNALMAFIHADKGLGSFTSGNSNYAGKYLKATSGWNSCGPSVSGNSYLCEDTHGFSALPGGYGYSGGGFYGVGNYGYWWSSSEYYSNNAYYRLMYYNYEYAYWSDGSRSSLRSVRCLQD